MNQTPLLVANENGFYCSVGDFYVDPWRPVKRAIITHAHADHFVRGCASYMVAQEGELVFRTRLGDDATIQSVPYGQTITISGVNVSFHPAGHILGSAQIRLEYKGDVWVISGDYKTENDHTSTPFEVVRCNHFITEATFGLPIYRWTSQDIIFDQINAWWKQNADEGKTSIIYCYALGKAQRIQASVDSSIGHILTHGSVERINQAYRASGVALPETIYAKEADKADYKRALIIAPLSARGTTYIRRFGEHASGYVSGWMCIRGARRRRAVDRGFVLSDHADWDGLLSVIQQTGAEHVGVTHGYTSVLSRWLQQQGLDSYSIDTRYAGENDDANESAGSEEVEE
ncbi:MAG: ligase-associated DNA damage response exonuclease [Anaerolineae bacterium]|nr:ligase-associated DNA damage response exonuclease [Anaerolineae bacterium]